MSKPTGDKASEEKWQNGQVYFLGLFWNSWLESLLKLEGIIFLNVFIRINRFYSANPLVCFFQDNSKQRKKENFCFDFSFSLIRIFNKIFSYSGNKLCYYSQAP